MNRTNSTPLLELTEVHRSFDRPDGSDLHVLDGINFTLDRGEIVGILGRSGSGKSTLLRIIAGLLPASAGEVVYLGEHVTGPPEGIAMVFQSFALFPWLTVLENVQLGLEALGLPAAEQRERAVDAIDLIGLDGFEQAYPRELSGGMQQRVGLARALVVHPKVLLMDEPFSALDVLTAETLRSDLLDLWHGGKLPIEAIVLVTHSIDEAVQMSDRVLVFSTKPGRVAADVPVTLPQPRQRDEPPFRLLVDHLYTELTEAVPGAPKVTTPKLLPADHPLPYVAPWLFVGLVEALAAAPYRGSADLPIIAGELQLEVDDLFPVAETLQQLRLAQVSRGDIHLTGTGASFAVAEGDDRKAIFGEQLLEHIGLIGYIVEGIKARPDQRLPSERVEEMLREHLDPDTADQTLQAAITWGRYAELFNYDDRRGYLDFEDH